MTAGEGARASRDRERSFLRPGDLERFLDRPSSTLRDIAQKKGIYLEANGLTLWQLFMKAFRPTFAELTESLWRVSAQRGAFSRAMPRQDSGQASNSNNLMLFIVYHNTQYVALGAVTDAGR